MTKEITLTRGMVALVDDEDYEGISRLKWYATRDGYAQHDMCVKGKRSHVHMHRVISGAQPGQETDHINHNKLDNRRANLRVCSPDQNKKNAPKSPKAKGSKYKGVKRSWLRWEAQIKSRGRYIYLGRYEKEEDAARAYDEAARRLFGEFACTNF